MNERLQVEEINSLDGEQWSVLMDGKYKQIYDNKQIQPALSDWKTIAAC